jgi:hypothetical protein
MTVDFRAEPEHGMVRADRRERSTISQMTNITCRIKFGDACLRSVVTGASDQRPLRLD